MEKDAASAFIHVVIRNVINILEKDDLIKDILKKNMPAIIYGLESAQEFVNIKFWDCYGNQLEDWLKKLGAVVLDAENSVDELNYHIHTKEINSSKAHTTKTKLLTYFSSRVLYGSERTLALRINEINQELISLVNMGHRFRFQHDGYASTDEPYGRDITESFSGDGVFVGRDDDLQKLADMLITNIEQEERVFSVLAIQGVDGIGKTTLARKLFNHEKIKTRFGESRIWVDIGPVSDPTLLYMKILATFTSDRAESMEEILIRLKQAFKGKTYLLVLNDIWINYTPRVADFLSLMHGIMSTKGNSIITTTRSEWIAEVMRPFHIHQLNGLSDDECWYIIKTITFGNQDVPSGFEITGREYAQMCQGLPLAAKLVGGFLRGASEDDWWSILSMLKNHLRTEENIVLHIFRWSFRDLHPSLKACSSYCSIFPQGCKIVKQELIELWMAEGFLQPENGYDMESKGDMISNILLHKSVLQVAERDENGRVESFVLHDLMHELLSSISGFITEQVAKYKRTLFLEGGVSDNILDYPSLRNLSLTRVKELPNSIRKLIHLRNLNISKSWITQLPDWIGELHNLQTLRADTKHLWRLPSTLKYLINLRHLYVFSRVKLPAEMGRLTNLRTLRHFAVGENKGAQIEELKNLNNLQGRIHVSNLEKVHNKEEAAKANMHQKQNLSELVFTWSEERDEGEIKDESVLEGLKPHPNLNKLEIVGFKGRTLPIWFENLSSLSHLCLYGCSNLERVSPSETLEQLTKLRHLDIIDCPNLEIGFKLHKTPHLTIKVDGKDYITQIVDGDMSYASNEVFTESHDNTPHFATKVDDHEIEAYTNEIVDEANEVVTESHGNTPHLTNKVDDHKIEPCSNEIVDEPNEVVIESHGDTPYLTNKVDDHKIEPCSNEIVDEPNEVVIESHGNTPHLTNKVDDHRIEPCSNEIMDEANEVVTESHGNTPHLTNKVDDHKIEPCSNEIVDEANEVESHGNTPHLTNKVDDHRIEPCSLETVVGDMASAANEYFIQILCNTLKEEYSSVGDAQQLQTTLGTIQSYLNDARNNGNEDVKLWLKELQDVSFKADNVLDRLSYHLLRNKVKKLKKPKAKDKVRSCFSSFNNIARQLNMASMIKEINMKFDFMIERAKQLGVQSTEPAAVAPGISSNPFTSDPKFIGRDDDVQQLVEMLISDPGETTFSILAIVGADGVGKETVTRKVLNHEDIKARFGWHIWVLASRSFDLAILYKRILSTLTSETNIGTTETEESILKKLQQALKEKTFILVLDDVCNEDVLKWENFISSISGVTSTRGNAIIITTKNSEVASSAIIITTKNTEVASSVKPLHTLTKQLHTHHLNGLSEENCWSIIETKSFPDGDMPLEHKVVGRKFAEGCQGLPLAANVLGGMLSYYKSKKEWLFVEKMLSSGKEAESISNILKLSFDSLPSSSLKMCFAYCTVFPKGWKIVKNELIELWMAEGFLQPNEGDDMESMGEMFSNVLVHNSILQVVERDGYGNVLSFVMHDLVHDLATAVLGSSDDTNQVLYLFHEKDHSSAIPKGTENSLRTLIFQGEILDTAMFSSYESLHALSLECDQVKELPSSIRELIHLRNLNVSRTRIEYLPDWISELHYLQTINASTESLRKLPSTLKYLISLRHLYLCHDVELPAEIGRLTNLQALKFRVGERKGYRIEELGSLNNLRQLCIYNLEKVRDKAEAWQANICGKQNLTELSLEWDANIEGEGEDDEAVLEGLEPHPGVKMLKIVGYKGKSFPSWAQIFEKLIEITLSDCQGCKEIPKLGGLPNLKTLSLWRLSKVKSINFSLSWNMEGVSFPALETLILTGMGGLELIEVYSYWRVFPMLVSFKLYWCDKLERLSSWFFVKARGLKEVDIRHCSKLSRLPDDLHYLDYLESVTIKGCQNLMSIVNGESGGRLTSLRSIEIRDCQKLTEMVELNAPLLKKVSLVELKSLQNLSKFLDSLKHSPSLAQLTIVGVPKFVSDIRSWSFQKLRKLEIDVTVEWSSESSKSIKKTVDSMLQGCSSSLGELRLMGLEIWDMPEPIQHLTALYNLELENFGVNELPEWFEGLSYLKRLCLSNFPKLGHLPSMKSFTELQEFHICNCPEIKIKYEGHKIFHRCAIYVNSHPL